MHSRLMARIPPILHKVLFTTVRNASIPAHVQEAHDTWRRLNPGYEVRLYDGKTALEALEQQGLADIADAMRVVRANAGKANLFRLGILYAIGGWYGDWKQTCLVPNLLSSLADYSANGVFACLDLGNAYSYKNRLYQNAFIGAPRRDPCILAAIRTALDHVERKHYGSNPLDTTGVGVWGRVAQTCGIRPGCTFQSNYFYLNRTRIVRHKCELCAKGQDWTDGNNYNTLWKSRRYYHRRKWARSARALTSRVPLQKNSV